MVEHNDPVPDTLKAVAAELLMAARDSEDIKVAGRTVGKSLATIATTIDNALLPLAALNFGIQAAKDYFTNKFQSEFAEKIADIPEIDLIDPKAFVAGPALQGLSFAIDEPDLKELYLNLLKTSVDGRVCKNAHPSFVEIIKQLSASEIPLLNQILRHNGLLEIVKLKFVYEDKSFSFIQNNLIGLSESDTDESVFNPDLCMMFDNWIRLGLIGVDYTRHKKLEGAYSWVESNPRFMELNATLPENASLKFDKGVCEVTQLGRAFGVAVGLRDSL